MKTLTFNRKQIDFLVGQTLIPFGEKPKFAQALECCLNVLSLDDKSDMQKMGYDREWEIFISHLLRDESLAIHHKTFLESENFMGYLPKDVNVDLVRDIQKFLDMGDLIPKESHKKKTGDGLGVDGGDSL